MYTKERLRCWRPSALATTLALASTGAGCMPPADHRPGAPQIGLARGARWSVMSIQPPYLTGPHFNLVLRSHVLLGWIAGDSAPGGAVRVQIESDGASGYGPLGPVTLDFEDRLDQTVAEGMWNGRRLKFAFSAGGLRGTVADNARQPTSAPLDRLAGMPAARDSSCQYVLAERDGQGALLGTSICDGLPQQTRLEVPAAAGALLDRAELITVLVAVLSAPPLDATELPGSPSALTADTFGADTW